MKIPPVEAELFHADGQTDRQDIAKSRFSQFLRTRLKNRMTNDNINNKFYYL